MKILTKKDVQKRISKNGKPLGLNKFFWDSKSNTFSSEESGLIIDFTNIDNCNFTVNNNCILKTGNYCTFNSKNYCTFITGNYCTFRTEDVCTFNTGCKCDFITGFNCSFKTSFYCNFNTKSDCNFSTSSHCSFNTDNDCNFSTGFSCTFKTSFSCVFFTRSKCVFETDSDCTFNVLSECTFNTGINCVIITRNIPQIIKPEEDEIIKTNPYNIPGYISKRKGENSFYMDTENGRKEYIITDSILSKVISKKKGIYKVINYNEKKESYLIEVDGIFSHGETLKEAKESLVYKLSDRDTSKYDNLTLDSVLSFKDSIQAYIAITGACSLGTKYFIDNNNIEKRSYTIKEIIKLTKEQYNHSKFKEFFKH